MQAVSDSPEERTADQSTGCAIALDAEDWDGHENKVEKGSRRSRATEDWDGRENKVEKGSRRSRATGLPPDHLRSNDQHS
ncbi:hypothetical protein R1flu_029020 [Riccia fluitans]|uniref:Uncharacterized protein n=1 Tax=Riccia fluitans TaxID=41844 RepID=A0ABD1XNB3_9MARC